MSQNAVIHIGVHWILGSYVNCDCRSQVGWSNWAVSGNYCCSGQSEGEVSLRRLKNNFSQRCKTHRAAGLRWHSSGDVLRFAQVDMGKDCGVHPSPSPTLLSDPHGKKAQALRGVTHLPATDVYFQKATEWYCHRLAVQQLPLPTDVHPSHLAVGEMHSNPHWREFPSSPTAAAQLCSTSSTGCCLQVAQRAAALSEVHMCKSQSAWSPQRNLIKENTQPCWFCSAARSFLFALHKSQASRFGPVFPNLFWTRKYWNRDLRRHWGSISHWRICFALQLLRLLLRS